MDPVSRTGTQSVPLPDNCSPPTLVTSMAIQCLSPTSANLPEDVMQRARNIEHEQRCLIAERDDSSQQGCHPNNTGSLESSDSIPNKCDPLKTLSPTMPTPPTGSIVPFSGASNIADDRRPQKLSRSRSFGGRRALRPRALDLNALRRERQFSGPYSANPLLPRKRRQSDDEPNTPDCDDNFKRSPPKLLNCDPLEPRPLESEPRDSGRSVRLPLISQMTTAPFIASGGSRFTDKLWPPLDTPSPRSGTSVSLPVSASQATLLTPPSATIPKIQAKCNSLMSNDSVEERASRFEEKRASGSLTAVTDVMIAERKARYMQLCSEIWDLMHN